MQLSLETKAQLGIDIECAVEKKIKEYPIFVVIDGYEMDIQKTRIEDGEITLYLDSPLIDTNGRVFKLVMEEI